VSDYRLDDRGSIAAEAKDFSSSLCVQTISDDNPASYPMGAGVKRSQGVALTHSPPSSVEVKNEDLYYSPPWRLHSGGRTALLFTFISTSIHSST
jgi:hypothetical protein